tara:strand:+ start:665 stop:907 length:243 start_codon:yes stop_codon:yes gene_type:complete
VHIIWRTDKVAIKIDVKKFEELLQIQQERQLAMQELSEKLGIDISFSDEEVMNFALEQYQEEINKQINQEVVLLMKSLFS